MAKNRMRGAVVLLDIVTVILILVFLGVFLQPKYEYAKLKKNFRAAVDAGEVLNNAAQTFFIENSNWPSSISDLRTNLDAKRVSDWEIANKKFTCELSYGRGERSRNDIQCSPIGKYASALHYQIILASNSLHKRLCLAAKTNPKANDMCKFIGGTFLQNKSEGGMVVSVYVINQ